MKYNGIPTNTDGILGGKTVLLCPVCGFEHVHLISVAVNPAGESGKQMVITKDAIVKADAKPVGRGVNTVLTFECEGGHCFQYSLDFHNGSTIVSSRARDHGRGGSIPISG